MLFDLLFVKENLVSARGTSIEDALQLARSQLPFAPFSEEFKKYSEQTIADGYVIHLEIGTHKRIDILGQEFRKGSFEIYGTGDTLEEAISNAGSQKNRVVNPSEITSQKMQILHMHSATIKYVLTKQARKKVQEMDLAITTQSEPKTIIGIGKIPLEALENVRSLLPLEPADSLFRRYHEHEPEMHKRIVIQNGKEMYFVEYLAKITYQLSHKGILRQEERKKNPAFQSLSLFASLEKEKKDIN